MYNNDKFLTNNLIYLFVCTCIYMEQNTPPKYLGEKSEIVHWNFIIPKNFTTPPSKFRPSPTSKGNPHFQTHCFPMNLDRTMSPFHVYSPFPTSDPRSYPIHEVSQFEYLGLILDPKLTMHLATVEATHRASQGQDHTLSDSYSLRYDKNSSQLTPHKTSVCGK